MRGGRVVDSRCGRTVRPFLPDVAGELIEAVAADLGRLDILVNNAAVALDNFITGVADEPWAATLATNLPARSLR